MQLDLFNWCSQCGQEHAAVATIVVTIHRSQYSTSVYHLCSENCRQHFALGHMRRLEGNNEETRTDFLAGIVRELGQ